MRGCKSPLSCVFVCCVLSLLPPFPAPPVFRGPEVRTPLLNFKERSSPPLNSAFFFSKVSDHGSRALTQDDVTMTPIKKARTESAEGISTVARVLTMEDSPPEPVQTKRDQQHQEDGDPKEVQRSTRQDCPTEHANAARQQRQHAGKRK